MSEEESERVAYYLSESHEWTDLEDIHPSVPKTPDDLCPVYLTADPVGDVDDLYVYGTPPEFDLEGGAATVTPAELAKWRETYARCERAQALYRKRIKSAAEVYDATVNFITELLREEMKEYKLIEETLVARRSELASVIRSHKEAAKAWEREQEEKREADLDSQFGPRCISLYRPENLTSYKQSDRVARVHLLSCGRQPKQQPTTLRAKDAWETLMEPGGWAPSSSIHPKEMVVKLCNSCKPWKVFMAHIDNFPELLRKVKLTEWPEGLGR